MRTVLAKPLLALLLILGACGGAETALDDTDLLPAPPRAWSVETSDAASISVVSEVSDLLPSVERQVGVDGPRRPFLDDPLDGLLLRGRVTAVNPWYSVAGAVVEEGATAADDGSRQISEYGVADALWSEVLLTVEVDDDFGAQGFHEDSVVLHARGELEEFEPYVAQEAILVVGRGNPYVSSDGDRREREWAIGSINPIGDDGTIDWHESLTPGRSTTIDRLEEIAVAGEIVVTEGGSYPPVVIERRPRGR